MNFLELVKRLAVETGAELEAKITTVTVAPATAYGETTEHRSRLVKWIQQSWIEIQEDQPQWDFMVDKETMPLVSGQVSYPIKTFVDDERGEEVYDEIIPFVAPVDRRYIWISETIDSNVQRQHSYYVHPEHFFGDRDRYNMQSRGIPYRWSIDRTGCIVFDANIQDDDHFLEFSFKRLPQALVDADDELYGIPARFHMLVVYQAMVFHAGFDESEPQYKRASKLRRDMLNKMRLRYTGEYSLPGTRS